MLPRGFLFVLTAFASFAGAGAWAQAPVGDDLVLRSTYPGDGLAEDDEALGNVRVVREQPAGQATLDETTTGSLARRPRTDPDPYAPLGIRSGGFILYPAMTFTLGHTSNAASASGGAAAGYGILAPELSVRSDWARHEATLMMRGSLQHYFDGTTSDKPRGSVRATGRLDLLDGATIDADASYAYGTQELSDPDFPATVDSPPGVHDLAASLVYRRSGRLLLETEGRVGRGYYENGTSGGSTVDQGDRNTTVFGGRLRLGYAVTPSFAPFGELEVARRLYDRTVDTNGLMRAATVQTVRAGVRLDRSPVLTGEIAVGATLVDFDEPTFTAIHATAIDGFFVWAPTALTTVNLRAATAFRPTTDPASPGSIVHDASLEVAYAWRRNVTLSASAGVRREAFEATGQLDTGASAGFSATWKLNRNVWIVGGYEHEWLVSNFPGRAYQSDAVRMEIRTQR